MGARPDRLEEQILLRIHPCGDAEPRVEAVGLAACNRRVRRDVAHAVRAAVAGGQQPPLTGFLDQPEDGARDRTGPRSIASHRAGR